MEDGGIAHRLKDNSAFLCLAKMLVAVIRTTILAGALWVGVPSIETDAKEDAVLLDLVGGVFAMNEPDERTKPSI